MNLELQSYARTYLIENLKKCTDEQVLRFKRMYSEKDLTAHINDVVNKMAEEKLDWAMQQIERTLKAQGIELWSFQKTSTS